MKRYLFSVVVICTIVSFSFRKYDDNPKIRKFKDTIGFAHKSIRMDSIIGRITVGYCEKVQKILKHANVNDTIKWKVAISPHDDYSYAGYLYTAALCNMEAGTVIVFGVAHKAGSYGIDNKIVFETFTAWECPYGNVKISPLRDEIIAQLPEDAYLVHDSLHIVEHSIEALLPFLQYNNRDLEIIPIIVPYMPYEKMEEIARPLADAIHKVMTKHNYQWGRDFSIAISNDCVHYGDEG